MGPRPDELVLADNMWGAEFVPQTSVLPLVDAVITHGGNNTTTESVHFGKPMVLLPIFWDQHDNAQRVHETGFGERLPTYSFTDEEISRAIDGLVGEDALHAKLGEISKRLQANPGNVRAADLIERLAETGEPVTD